MVSAPGQVDLTNAGELRQAVLSCTDAGHMTLVVDMSETAFCDSAGVNQLVQAHKRAVAAGGELRLVIGTASVMRILSIVGADRMLSIFTRVDEAVAEEHAPSSPT